MPTIAEKNNKAISSILELLIQLNKNVKDLKEELKELKEKIEPKETIKTGWFY
jgi:hypothetical protein|tara:strand:+ start:78 stop:236 length:159 start_codon:yes stop_codon:yes gene_type:complete